MCNSQTLSEDEIQRLVGAFGGPDRVREVQRQLDRIGRPCIVLLLPIGDSRSKDQPRPWLALPRSAR